MGFSAAVRESNMPASGGSAQGFDDPGELRTPSASFGPVAADSSSRRAWQAMVNP